MKPTTTVSLARAVGLALSLFPALASAQQPPPPPTSNATVVAPGPHWNEGSYFIGCGINNTLGVDAGVLAIITNRGGAPDCMGEYLTLQNPGAQPFLFGLDGAATERVEPGMVRVVRLRAARGRGDRTPTRVALFVRYLPPAAAVAPVATAPVANRAGACPAVACPPGMIAGGEPNAPRCECPPGRHWEAAPLACAVNPTCPPGQTFNGTVCACPVATPLWVSSQNRCEVCPPAHPVWSGSQCGNCSPATPLYNAATLACEACPPNAPAADGHGGCAPCRAGTVWNGSACVVTGGAPPPPWGN